MGESQDNGMLALQLTVNGREHATQVHYLTTLLILLREHLGLNGTKIGCGHGQCGACTVLIDGERKLSCLTFAATMEGRTVTTIEGLSTADSIHPMQAAFLRHEAYQCGYLHTGPDLVGDCGTQRRQDWKPRRSCGSDERQPMPLRHV